MTHQEKEALLKRIYALPTEWADEGGSYGKGGPVGSEDAALLWPEDVIDAINQFAPDTNVARKDPITGLVPCGGRKAVLYCTVGEGFWVACSGVSQANRYETEAFAIKAWNESMGYTAPPRPGAIVPDAGEIAPNGDEGAGE